MTGSFPLRRKRVGAAATRRGLPYSLRLFSKAALLACIVGTAAQPTSATAQKTTYRYDSLGRLVQVESPHSVAGYVYDKAGNRTQVQSQVLNHPERYCTIAVPLGPDSAPTNITVLCGQPLS